MWNDPARDFSRVQASTNIIKENPNSGLPSASLVLQSSKLQTNFGKVWYKNCKAIIYLVKRYKSDA